ncbi:MAG: hypothetical protein AB7H97_21310 [Pseudobdellovibrionaceae bacterium]
MSHIFIFFFFISLLACTSAQKVATPENGGAVYIENPKEPFPLDQNTLIKVFSNPEKGFNFAYYLYVPMGIKKETSSILYVEPNNTGTQNDDLSIHDNAARKFIESSYSHRIAKKLNSPMLVPVFPRPARNWQEYTHYLNRRTMKISEGPLKRIDLQLRAMIQDARVRLSQNGIPTAPKVFMNGFSSSAGFSLRFTALHPGLIQATAAGGINAMPILPIKKYQKKTLPYPIGIGDLSELTGIDFDSKTFLKIPQKLYMGADDTNDTVPFRDAWDSNEANFIQQTFGKKMQPDRWEKVQKIYKATGASVTFTTYLGVGHKVTPEIEEDIFQFFFAHREVK